MNDLRSPLEDRPSFRTAGTRGDDRVMATSEYYRTRLGSLRNSKWFPLVAVLGGVLAFSGIVSYAHKQGMQSGENATTPIIQADAGDFKQKPENPGGMEVPFQDAVVFEQLQKTPEGQTATETVENLLEAPEQPVAETTPAATATTEVATNAATPASEAPVTPPPATTPSAATTPEQPAATQTTETSVATTTTTAPAVETTPASAQPAVQAAVTPPAVEEVKKIAEVAPASAAPATKLETGTFRIQMGAFRDEAAARSAWAKFQKEFNSQLANVTPDFPRADLGAKGTFYRVQGINLSKASADELCRSLNAARAGSCMVVK
jgi:hypothetical protein